MMSKRFCVPALSAGLLCLLMVGCPMGTTTGLKVSPTALGFTDTLPVRAITITNGGAGLLTWTVQEDVSWLTPSQTTGTTLTETDHVTFTADASGLAPGTYADSVRVVSNAGTQSLAVVLHVSGTPALFVEPSILNMVGNEEEATLTITNPGTDRLTWNISVRDPEDPDAIISPPEFMTITPQNGTTDVGEESTVLVEIDRSSLDAGMYEYTLIVSSDAGTQEITLNLAQGLSAEIGVEPAILEFGQDLNTLALDVFNIGYAGSRLDFTLTTDRPDLIFFSPSGGSSIGPTVSDLDYDRVPITVTIDRGAVESDVDGGVITVSADGVDPVDVTITVERSPLTFEGAINRTRPPFILRFVFLLRDDTGEAIDTTSATVFQELQDAFTIWEDGEQLDPFETESFVTSADNLRYNLMLLLDYTGSMYYAGTEEKAREPGEVIELMEAAAAEFIEDLPSSYRIGLMEYHERQQTNRLIHGFSTAKEPLTSSLEAFSLPPADHGASELYDALEDAVLRLSYEDIDALPFEDADVRALVFISDGRDTSSVTSADEVIELAREHRVRMYPIGFGENVDAAPLVKLATRTGGHYYAAPNDVDLINLLERNLEGSSGTPGVITQELERQIVLTYVSLFQDGTHTYLIRCIYDDLEGYFEEDGVYSIGGDVRAGQIGLNTTGIQESGLAEVFVRTEYVPRNITQFRFRVFPTPAYPFTLELAPDGILEKAPDGTDRNWLLVPEGGDVWTVLTTEDNPLLYGEFGDLLKITFEGLDWDDPEDAGDTFDVIDMGFRVDNRVYLNPPVTKFFQYPDSLTIQTGSTQATEIPISIDDGFDPDDPDAWDRDEDSVADFDDNYPDDPDHS